MLDAINWRSLSTADREREYSPSSCIGGNYQPFIRAYAEQSAAARAAHPPKTVRYGAQPANAIDLFLPPQMLVPPPLVAFIHGGYWQELSKEFAAGAAAHCLPQGIAYAAIGYTLAPKASLAEIVTECRAALRWLADNAATLGFDAHRISVAGSSAGAHLAAMCALDPAAVVKGAILLSGIYDLEPLIGTSINDALHLDQASAVTSSPLAMPLANFPPSLVCWGDNETAQFKQQSRVFAAAIRDAGVDCIDFEIAARNHFNVVQDLADPATRLGQCLTRMVNPIRS